MRLATGEHAHTRWQIKELLDSGAVGVIQADQDWAGGITEQLHICSLCSAYDVPVVAHGHAVPAALHVAASQSPQTVPMIEYLVRIQDRNQHFHQTIYRPVEGAVALPTGPGLGIDLDPDEDHRAARSPLRTVTKANLRVGLIGAGGVARTHAEHLGILEGVEVTAVADVSADRAEALASDCGAKALTDHRGLLDLVDVVYVCSPPTTHREHVTAAVAAGRHVFCEKPLATTLEDGRAIAEAVSSKDVQVMVGFNNRFRAPFRRLRELLRSGELGDLVSAWITRVEPSTPALGTNWRTTPGLACGVTIESAAHDIDLIRWAFGEVATVAGSTSSSLPGLLDYDDTLNAVLWLEGGAAVSVTISWTSAIGASSRGIVGTAGAACLLGPNMWTLTELRWARSGRRRRSNRSTSGRGPTLATCRSRDTSSSAFGRIALPRSPCWTASPRSRSRSP